MGYITETMLESGDFKFAERFALSVDGCVAPLFDFLSQCLNSRRAQPLIPLGSIVSLSGLKLL